jgi:hypothetical protein
MKPKCNEPAPLTEGRGTRAECIENAFRLADEHAIESFSTLENEADEARALNGTWRLVLWPPGSTQIHAFGRHRQVSSSRFPTKKIGVTKTKRPQGGWLPF